LTNGPVSLCSRDERSSPVRSSPVQSSWTNGQAGWTIPSARDERPDERSSCPSTMPKVPSTSTVPSTSSVEGLRDASRDERCFGPGRAPGLSAEPTCRRIYARSKFQAEVEDGLLPAQNVGLCLTNNVGAAKGERHLRLRISRRSPEILDKDCRR